MSTFAENGIGTQVVTALTSVATDMTTAIGSILPVVLTVVGAGLVINFCIKFFSRLVKKA